jgi:hypothetical protein
MRTASTAALLSLATLAPASFAQPTRLYFENFESGTIGPEWNAGSRVTNGWPIFTFFNGNYSSSFTTLTLTQPSGGLPGGSNGSDDPPGPAGRWLQYWVAFDFYALDSWDGDMLPYGPDRFMLAANGVTIFNETFANQPGCTQSFRAPDVGPAMLGFNPNAADSIYRRITVPFTVPMGESIRLTWGDGGLQGMNDESWGIDNIDVTYQVVPAPGLGGVGAAMVAEMGLLRRRRRTG